MQNSDNKISSILDEYIFFIGTFWKSDFVVGA